MKIKITLDLETSTIVVPDNFYDKINDMNTLLKNNGGTEIDYTAYIKREFEKAIANPVKRKMDVVVPRGSRAPKVSK